MNQQAIFDTIVRHTKETLPSLAQHSFRFDDTLRDLGANSIDRSEIIMLTLESLSLQVALVELASAANIGKLATRLAEIVAERKAGQLA